MIVGESKISGLDVWRLWFFSVDPNERRYFISPQSVELAIKEEQAKVATAVKVAETIPNVRRSSTTPAGTQSLPSAIGSDAETKTLEWKIRDLEITNKVKDQIIQRMEKDQERFVDKIVTFSHRIGELETRLLQLESP